MSARATPIAALASAALLSACATTPAADPANPGPTPPITGSCKAEPASFGVGQTYTPALGARMQAAASARTLRVTRPGDVVTLEFSPSRLGVELDEKGAVARVRCG